MSKPSFKNKDVQIFFPGDTEDAFAGTTHLGVGAHQDDLEILATHGIIECSRNSDLKFSGITCTNGSGTPAKSLDANSLIELRNKEQIEAARIGKYSFVAMLNYDSSLIKSSENQDFIDDLLSILNESRPEVIYTHNLMDRHPSHVAVALGLIKAIRMMPKDARPKKVYGTEVWRSLDWLGDSDKLRLVIEDSDLQSSLVNVYQSEIQGGKRYDLAVTGRSHSNATFSDYDEKDQAEMIWYAVDMTELVKDDMINPKKYALGLIEKFKESVKKTIEEVS